MLRIGESAKASITYRPRPGAYAILRKGDAVLLTFQAAPTPEFQLPGGGIDFGESPLAALHREVFEETGWRIARPRKLGAFRRFTFMPEYNLWAEKICHIYVAQPVLCLGPPSETGHAAVWSPISDAAQIVGNPGDRHFIRRHMLSL